MPLAGKRLLVVSADGELARLVADASSRHGASVVLCSGGRAALDADGADAAIVDLPVADFRPDALLIALRRRGLKTVAVSGVLAASRYAATALRFGAAAFLEKPVDAQDVLSALTAVLLSAASPTSTSPPPGSASGSEAATASENATACPIPTPIPPPSACETETPIPTPSAPLLTPIPALTPLPTPLPSLTATPLRTPSPFASASETQHPALTPFPLLTPLPALTPLPSLTPLPPPASSTAPAPQPQQPRDPALDASEDHQDPSPAAARTDTEAPGKAPVEAEPSTATYPVADDLDSYVFSEALPALDENLPDVPAAPSRREGLAAPLPATPVPAACRPGSAPALPEGDLAVTSVPRLLAALHAARTTGALTLSQALVKKLVLLEEGRPVFAASNVPSERFAARCVREGILGEEAVEVIAALIGPKEPLNEALLARGLLDDARRTRMFGEQIREILWSTFEWRTGSYRLLTGPRARRPIARVEIPTGELILEGFRRTATLAHLRQDLPASLALAAAPAPPFQPGELPMSEPEALMVSLADGTKTVSDLVVLSGVDERSALAFLAGSRAMGILAEVRRALAETRRIGFM